jgi:hypothetical protein
MGPQNVTFTFLSLGHPTHPLPRFTLCAPARLATYSFSLGLVAQWLEPAAHNGLVAGSSPAGPTTQSVKRRPWAYGRHFRAFSLRSAGIVVQPSRIGDAL